MAAEQLPTVVITAANILYSIPVAVIRAKMAGVRVKMVGMQEYPRPFLNNAGVGSPNRSIVSNLAMNIDCEVSP